MKMSKLIQGYNSYFRYFYISNKEIAYTTQEINLRYLGWSMKVKN